MSEDITNRILVTGASGFVGSVLLSRLLSDHNVVVAPVRPGAALPEHPLLIMTEINELSDIYESSDLVSRCNVVIHIAAKAHSLNITAAEYKRVNTDATLSLAKQAAKNGAQRFIFLSSIGVNGIQSSAPFKCTDAPAPVEDYAFSKLNAEIGLKQIAADTGMEVVIIRPPLVYGCGAPGNFGKLARLVQKNLPLPLGAIRNKRSLVALDNLVDLITTCINHPKAANQTFLVSDDQDVSTTELLHMMTVAADKKPRLLPVPVSWLRFAGKLTGKQAVIDRLCGNLQVDIEHTKATLGWTPPVSVEEGIARCFAVKG